MNTVLRFLMRIWIFALFGAIFLVLLVVGVLGVLVLTAWSLLTGKQPLAFAQFSNIMRASKGFRDGAWPPAGANPRDADANVVDVQAHEVRSTLENRR